MFDLTNKVVTHMTVYVDDSSHNAPSYVYAKQNDANSRYVVLKIMSSSGQITSFGTARLNVITPDGTMLYGLGEKNQDGTVTFELSQAMVASVGKVTCDVMLYEEEEIDENSEVLTTSTFFLVVDRSIYSGDAMESSGTVIPGSNYYTKTEIDEIIDGLEGDYYTKSEVDAMFEEANYKKIEIESFSVSPSSVEVGSTVTSLTFAWSTSKVPVEIKILYAGNVIATPEANSTSFTLGGQSITSSTSTTRSYQLSVKEAQSGNHQETVTTGTTGNTSDAKLSFLYRRYWGVGATLPNTSSMSSELSNSRSKTFTVNAGNEQYIWYVYKKTFGTATFKVGGFEGGFTLIGSQTITNAYGADIECYVYRSDNPSLGSTTVVVS